MVGDFGLASNPAKDPVCITARSFRYLSTEYMLKYNPRSITSGRKLASTAQDMYAVGVIAYELLGRFYLPEELDNLNELGDWTPEKRAVRAGYQVTPDTVHAFIPGVSDACVDFLCACLAQDPAERLTASQALKHPWVAEEMDASIKALAREKELLAATYKDLKEAWEGTAATPADADADTAAASECMAAEAATAADATPAAAAGPALSPPAAIAAAVTYDVAAAERQMPAAVPAPAAMAAAEAAPPAAATAAGCKVFLPRSFPTAPAALDFSKPDSTTMQSMPALATTPLAVSSPAAAAPPAAPLRQSPSFRGAAHKARKVMSGIAQSSSCQAGKVAKAAGGAAAKVAQVAGVGVAGMVAGVKESLGTSRSLVLRVTRRSSSAGSDDVQGSGAAADVRDEEPGGFGPEVMVEVMVVGAGGTGETAGFKGSKKMGWGKKLVRIFTRH